MGEYTKIKVIVNLTEQTVIVRNHEYGTTQSVAPKYADVVGELVVPYATSKDEYEKGRKLSVSTRVDAKSSVVGRAWFWEDTNMVYTNTSDGWNNKVTSVVGCCWWNLMVVSYKDGSKEEKDREFEVTLHQIR